MPLTRTVSNAQELQAALSASAGGDTILLRPGDYGQLTLTGTSFASNVTIKSETYLGARFAGVRMTDVDHLTFDGIQVAGEFRAWNGSESISLFNSDVNGGAYFMAAQGITLKKNYITTGGEIAVIFNDVDHVKVIGNTIHDAREDLLRVTGDSADVRIAYNHLLDTHSISGDHPDAIQFFGREGHTPTNVRIVGNIIYDDPATGHVSAQGIFVSDPTSVGYRDILIADNLINVGSPNGIYINGGISNVLVRDNVNAALPNGGGGSIRVVEKAKISNGGTTIEHNFARQILDETTKLSDGIKFVDNTIKTVRMADLLANWESHLGSGYDATPHGVTMTDLLV